MGGGNKPCPPTQLPLGVKTGWPHSLGAETSHLPVTYKVIPWGIKRARTHSLGAAVPSRPPTRQTLAVEIHQSHSLRVAAPLSFYKAIPRDQSSLAWGWRCPHPLTGFPGGRGHTPLAVQPACSPHSGVTTGSQNSLAVGPGGSSAPPSSDTETPGGRKPKSSTPTHQNSPWSGHCAA